MHEHAREGDPMEPQTEGELLRAIYRRQTDIVKVVFGNGKPGLCDRVTIMETTVKVLAGIIVVGVPCLIAWLYK